MKKFSDLGLCVIGSSAKLRGMKMIHNEWFGEIPYSLHLMLKKYNVSPADFYMMEGEYGGEWHRYERAIIQNSCNSKFDTYLWMERNR